MGWDVTDNGYSVTLINSDGHQKTIFKSEIAVVVNADDTLLQIESSQSPYKVLCSWTEDDITDLTGATTIADGFTLLEGYMADNTP